MKKIVFGLIMLTSFFTNAQETEFTFTSDKGMTDFIVTPVEGKTASEIYKKVIEWIKVTFKNPEKVILSTIENEYVRFEGITNDIDASKYKYQIELSVKDGRYKFDLISLQFFIDSTIYGGTIGWNDMKVNFNNNSTKEEVKGLFRKDGTYKNYLEYVPKVPIFFNNLNKSLTESIVSNVKKSDGW
jgi:hypothetical protein